MPCIDTLSEHHRVCVRLRFLQREHHLEPASQANWIQAPSVYLKYYRYFICIYTLCCLGNIIIESPVVLSPIRRACTGPLRTTVYVFLVYMYSKVRLHIFQYVYEYRLISFKSSQVSLQPRENENENEEKILRCLGLYRSPECQRRHYSFCRSSDSVVFPHNGTEVEKSPSALQ